MGLDMSKAETAAYGMEFFAALDESSRRSADAVIPLLLELFSPQSVLDVGGGSGQWAAACISQGVSDVLTVDGPWVPPSARVIPGDRFLEHDLTLPLSLDRTFDLALCLEAAEHLPASAAPHLVRALTEAAPVVVFSAALPGQGGEGHINEQPPSYWARLFAAQNYACFADLRHSLWNNPAVEVWYRQNLLCFVRETEQDRWGSFLSKRIDPGDPMLDIAHPDLLLSHKLNAERLDAYSRRLEADFQRCHAELNRITNSRAWRAWQFAAGPVRLLKRNIVT